MQIGLGFSQSKNPVQAVKEALNMARQTMAAAKEDLAIVFSTPELSSNTLLRALNDSSKGIVVIGASAPQVICNQGIFKQGLVLLLISFSTGINFNVAYYRGLKQATLESGKELAIRLCEGLRDKHRALGLLLGDIHISEDSGFMDGFKDNAGAGFPLVGAFISSSHESVQYAYLNRDLLRDSCVGLLLAGKLYCGIGSYHGWIPLGKPHQITLAEGNLIKEIDNKPAVSLYEEYLGSDRQGLIKNLGHISMLYPLGLPQKEGREYLLRSPVSIEEDGALRIMGSLTYQRQVRLMMANQESCLEAARQAVENANLNFAGIANSKIKKFALIFSSLARGKVLRRNYSTELEVIKSGLGEDIPVIGVCNYSGFAPQGEINYQRELFINNHNVSILSLGG
ncbi:MAG: FIST N-terminal domain-containing protein [Candidatus Omnitrophota bacterium]|nr:FIST C-terminal domain-containing protein [Candidatus Omnitrophota bacterium]